MTVINKTVLLSRNARDKVQVAIAELVQESSTFFIRRSTGQYLGKMSVQPEIVIERGKAKRSVIQQAELEYNSIINKYLDKGYKKLSDLTKSSFAELTAEEIDELVPTIKSDTSGNLKPMLAKDYNKVQTSVLNKKLFLSKKLNGVRCMMKLKGDEVVTISRGGKNYDASTKHLTPEVYEYLKDNPSVVLDGELYRHGHYLQELSGVARLQEWSERCEILQYWIYDIADGEMNFEDRREILEEIKEFFEESENIKVLDHIETNSWEQIQRLHDKWVKEGFEGAVARKGDKSYEFGKRGSTMLKIKAYSEEEFEIIDYAEKMRDEDFCFIMQTKEGKPFEAKPIGTREMKDWYLENMDEIIGKKGVVKFFEWSKDKIPLQPVFQAVRYDLD
jgi:ATP-dependent DNA ligase